MAGVNIFERYGIKEVANVYFQALDSDAANGINTNDIVLYLDTLKVSTTEETAEQVDARGGWSNPKLITWDYNKEIKVTLEDAVISWEEMRLLMGGSIKNSGTSSDGTKVEIYKNASYTIPAATTIASVSMPSVNTPSTINGKNSFPASSIASAVTSTVQWVDVNKGARGIGIGDASTPNTLRYHLQTNYTTNSSDEVTNAEAQIRLFWTEKIGGEATASNGSASEIVISPDTWPGTYRVVGDTLIRKASTGKDEAYQFVINKAKIASNVTLTMQAEGDPSTFSMELNVLRDNHGNMMSLKKYTDDAYQKTV